MSATLPTSSTPTLASAPQECADCGMNPPVAGSILCRPRKAAEETRATQRATRLAMVEGLPPQTLAHGARLAEWAENPNAVTLHEQSETRTRRDAAIQRRALRPATEEGA